MPAHVLTPPELLELRAQTPRVQASTAYAGYAPPRLTDGNPETSWFSARDDSAAKGTRPYVEVTFDRPRPLDRVTVLGNREPKWLQGFSVREATLEVFDDGDRLLASRSASATGDRADFTFDLGAVERVRRVRLTSTQDDGDRNEWGDIAIGELILE